MFNQPHGILPNDDAKSAKIIANALFAVAKALDGIAAAIKAKK